MGFSVQNTETGEMDYIQCDDYAEQLCQSTYDKETGEPLNNAQWRVRYIKHKRFQIPKQLLRATVFDEFDKEMTDDYSSGTCQPRGVQSKPKKLQKYQLKDYLEMDGVRNDIILGYNKRNIHLFLIPSVFFFNIYVAFIIALLEMFLHVWAHRKNGLNMNKVVYYRSPLHVLTSQFCAVCRADSEGDRRIFDMLSKQMRMDHKAKHTGRGLMKDVSKAIS